MSRLSPDPSPPSTTAGAGVGADASTIPPLPSDRDSTGRDLGDDELRLLAVAIRSGVLNCTHGTMVRRFERAFAAWQGSAEAVACASGSAAVHAALAAVGLDAGDEVVTSPITDMGAILPVLFQGALPRFCDVDPGSLLPTPETVAAALGPRTRAVIVTHLFGQACDVVRLAAMLRRRGVVLIEDCAQAFGATVEGRRVGSFGAMACYSFQQGKHMTTGEGGMVTTDDAALADSVRRFVNKGWGYGDDDPDHDRPGLNYRLTELQGAVGLAQLGKLDAVVQRRRAAAARLSARLSGRHDVAPVPEPAGHAHSFWRYCLMLSGGDPDRVAARLRAAAGIVTWPRYVRRPAYRCGVLRDWRRHAVVRGPVAAAGVQVPTWEALAEAGLPGVERGLARCLVLPWNEAFRAEHVDVLADALERALLAGGRP